MSDDLFFQEKKGRKLYFTPVLNKGKRSLSFALDAETQKALNALLKKDDALSGLAVLKQEAKDFRWRQMSSEREKRGQLAPLYQVARQLLPGLGVSQQNLLYFASLANFYTIHDLRNLRKEQTWLYLLCYI